MKTGLVRFILLLSAAVLLCGCHDRDDQGAGLIEKATRAYVQGYYSQAREVYEDYIKNYPHGRYRSEAWNRLIDIAVIVNNNLDKGIELTEAMFLEISRDKEKSFSVLNNLGDLYQLSGNNQKAIDAWQRCLDVADPPPADQAELYLKIANVYREMASYDFAMEYLSDCIEVCGTGESGMENGTGQLSGIKNKCMYKLAQNAIFIQNWDYAETILTELANTKGIDEETKSLAYFMLADVYEHKRDPEKARGILLKIQDTYPNPNAVKARLEVLGKSK